MPTLDAQFWNSYVAFMKKGADELGLKLVVLNADTSAIRIPGELIIHGSTNIGAATA